MLSHSASVSHENFLRNQLVPLSSKRGSGPASSISLTWALVRHAGSQFPSQTYWIRNSAWGPSKLQFNTPAGDSHEGELLSITDLKMWSSLSVSKLLLFCECSL